MVGKSGSPWTDFEAQEKPEYKFMDLKKYYRFHKMINKMSTHGPVKSWAHQRLRFLEDKFRIHTAQFGDDELEEIKVLGCCPAAL